MNRERLVVVATLNEIKTWIEDYPGPPERLKDFLLERLKNTNINEILDLTLQEIFRETITR